jgi:hypothetical protein
VIAGGAAGALIGLLFVAVSIRIDVIARAVEFRNRAVPAARNSPWATRRVSEGAAQELSSVRSSSTAVC